MSESEHGRSAFATGCEILEISDPFRIGKHEWRLTLYRTREGKVYTGYEWRKPAVRIMGTEFPPDFWRRDVDWPRYDLNDGLYAGLPKTLLRLWERCPWASREEVEKRRAESARS